MATAASAAAAASVRPVRGGYSKSNTASYGGGAAARRRSPTTQTRASPTKTSPSSPLPVSHRSRESVCATAHSPFALALALPGTAAAQCALTAAHAQRHGARSSPATAPASGRNRRLRRPRSSPSAAGLGAIQFVAGQLRCARAAGPHPPAALRRRPHPRRRALRHRRAGQYLQHGHIPMPRAIELELVNAIQQRRSRRAAYRRARPAHRHRRHDPAGRQLAPYRHTCIYPTPFYDPTTTPSTWLRTARSLVQADRYRAIFPRVQRQHEAATSLKTKRTSASSTARPSSSSASSRPRATAPAPPLPPPSRPSSQQRLRPPIAASEGGLQRHPPLVPAGPRRAHPPLRRSSPAPATSHARRVTARNPSPTRAPCSTRTCAPSPARTSRTTKAPQRFDVITPATSPAPPSSHTSFQPQLLNLSRAEDREAHPILATLQRRTHQCDQP